MNKLYYFIAAILVATNAFAIDTVKVNTGATYQTIKGWGGTGGQNTQFEGTPQYLLKQIIFESVTAMGLNGLRYESYQGSYSQSFGMHHTWEWTNDNGSPDTLNSSALDTGAVDNYMANLFVPWKNQVVANGDSFTFYYSPSWYFGGSTGDIPAFLRYSPGEYAEYYISNLTHLKNQFGLIPDYVTMCNEPGFGANQFTPSVEFAMMKTVMPRLQAAGFSNTYCQFPECVTVQDSWEYIDSAFSQPAIWPYIKCLSYHLYGTDDPYRHYMDSMATSLGIVTGQTEEIGNGIDELYADLTIGGVSYYDFYGNGDYCPQNANNTWFTHAAKYWTCREITHYNRPGSVRIDAVSNDTPYVRAIAFVKGGLVTTSILNDNASSVTSPVTVTGLPAGNYAVNQIYTSGSPYSELGVFTVVAGGVLTVTVPAGALVTIYPHSANLPPVPSNWTASPTYIELPTSTVNLASAGVDPELSTVTYHWTIDSFPAGSSPVFSNANIASPSVSGMTVAGNYQFSVHMADGSTDTTVRSVTLPVFPNNQAPVIAELQSRDPVLITLPVDTTLVKAFAYDIEADALTYSYSIVSQPIGAAALLVTPTTTNTVVRNMTLPGNYVIQYSVSDPTHTVSRNITLNVFPVNAAPVISSVTATPNPISLPVDSTQLSGVTSDPDGDIISHWWTVISTPTGASPTFQMQGERITEVNNLTVPGRYVFQLLVVDRTLYTTRLDTVMVNLGSTTVCVGSTTSFSDPTTGGVWTSSNTAIATVVAGTGIITGIAAGTVVISYTAAGVLVTGNVTVNATPSAGSITGTGTVCVGAATTLADATPGGTWSSVSPGIASVGTSGIVTAVSAGTATISYSVSNSCGTAAATAIVTVNPLPAAGTITGADFVCTGATTPLADGAGGGTWSSTAPGIASVGLSGIVTGVSAGTATISYTVSNSCGTAAATTIVTVNSSPSAGTITGTLTVCTGSATPLSDATTGGTWSSGSPGIATVGSTGIVAGVAMGTATISYSITVSCGTAVATAVVTINPIPAAGTITGAELVCVGATTTLADATGGGTWSSTAPGIASVGTSGIVTAVSAGTATISYSVSNSCGTAAATAIVTVNPLPTAGTITGTDFVCTGATTPLADGAGGGTWSSTAPGIASVGLSGIVTGVSAGTATISYTVSNSCGTAAATTIVTVNSSPSAGAIMGTLTVCTGSATPLSDATTGGTWSSGSPGIATVGSTGIVAGVAMGTATISYSITVSCGTAVATAVVTVTTTPVAGTITGTESVCAGAATILTDATGGGVWSSGSPGVATVGISGIVSGVAPGTATVSYSVTNSCGTSVATAVVTVNTAPSAGTITGTLALCSGATTALTDASAGGVWSCLLTTVATVGSTGIVTGISAGTATVAYSVTNSCGTAVATAAVTVNSLPAVAAISGIDTLCESDSLLLDDATTGGAWASYHTAIASISGTGKVTGLTPGMDTISYGVTNACGTTSVTFAIKVKACTNEQVNYLNSYFNAGLSIIPNPNNGGFTLFGDIGAGTQDEDVLLTVTDMLGRAIYKGPLTAVNGKMNELITLGSNVANGMYLLSVHSEHEDYVFHFVIEK